MIGRGYVVFTVAFGVLPLAVPGGGQLDRQEGPRTVVVDMVDFDFRPAEVRVRHGDTVRFVQKSASPHNVEFRDVPPGTTFGEDFTPAAGETGSRAVEFPTLRMGPFLVTPGATYDVVIDSHFGEGVLRYVCTPHEALGMTGKIVVVDPPPDSRAPGAR